MFSALTRAWTFARESVRLGARYPALRIAPLGLVAVWLVLAGLGYAMVTAHGWALDHGPGLWVSVGLGAVAWFAYYWLLGATVSMVELALRGGRPTLGEGLADATKNAPALAVLALIATALELLTRAMRRQGRGGPAHWVASLLETGWAVYAFLLLPAIIIEDCSFVEATRQVARIHRGDWLPIAVNEVGVRVLTFVVGVVAVLVAAAVLLGAAALGGGSPGVFPVGLAIAIAVVALATAFQLYVRAAYYTCLYVWAVAPATGHASAADAPAPLRAALAA